MTIRDNDVKKDAKEPAEGTYKGHKDEKSRLDNQTDSDIYANSECEESDTNIKIPTDNSVEVAREWTNENRK